MHPAAEAWEHVDADSSQARGSPQYCCVILVRHTTPTDFPDFLVEQRPAAASVAGGQLTCFGGKREQGEEPLAALLRECEEELGWAPPDVVRACDLFVNGELVAWFYLAAAPPPGTPLRFESGVEAIWATSVTDPRLSPWHAAVLQAWSRGEQRVDLAGSA
ncbi:hypothetical protein KFE25_008768 [Diacronema lutheri]|uniref:Nudix hydrolase domain-containing protein n=1 Tax=Diacronema lutheri TaxID=2081491 RepID=A0A8J6CCX8_DIALT|nr:hypothetical protein KFE25_008768 [Diacronema lutheri]